MTRSLATLQAWLDERSSPFLWAGSIALVVLVGWLDVITGPDITLSLLYLFPVSLAGWFIAGRGAYAICVLCSAAALGADLASGHEFSSPLVPYWNAGARLGLFAVTVYLLTSLRRSLEHERQLARTDSLTGVANARHLYEVAEIELARARRYHRELTVAYVDLDDFKAVNDDFGHRAGDSLLRVVATSIQRTIRVSDTIARLGGDEFAILFPETGDSAEAAVGRVHAALSRAMTSSETPVTFSIGAVTFATIPATVDELIWAADRFMYSIKRRGKNSVSVERLERAEAGGPGHRSAPGSPGYGPRGAGHGSPAAGRETVSVHHGGPS